METVKDLVRVAREMQTAGNVDEAISLYEKLLGEDPKNAFSLHAMGVLLNRRAEFGRAAAMLEQAVVLRPSEPTWHVDLGESYRNLGAYRDAIGCCLTGLRFRQEYPEGWNTLGLALRGS